MSARPMDALAVRNLMVSDMSGAGSMGWRINELILNSHRDADEKRSRDQRVIDPPQFMVDTLNALTMHPTYWISRDMQALATAAAEELPDEYTIEAHDLPSSRGLIVFAQPLHLHEIRGRVTRTHAMTWHRTGGDKLVIMAWAYKHDEQDEVNQGVDPKSLALYPSYIIDHVVVQTFAQPIIHSLSMEGALIPPDADIYGDGTSVNLTMAQNKEGERGKLFFNPDPRVRLLSAIWRLMQQTISVVRDEEAPRPVARASKRLDLVPLVTVIELRQFKYERRGEGQEIEWSHRWLRRGHWRRQWYKVDGVPVQKAIYIHQTICGPEDKPLVIKDHVMALIR